MNSESSSPREPNDRPAGWLRVLDANFNRLTEGLRVVEDHFRFVCNDAALAGEAKRIRHGAADLLRALDADRIILARNVPRDVGRDQETDQEYARHQASDLLVAGLKRSMQSLRSIEECLKLHSRELAARAESLRYDVYQLEYAFAAGSQIAEDPSQPQLCCLLDARPNLNAFESLAEDLIAAGVDWIQLRAKSLNDREIVQRGETLSRLTRGTPTRWIMNDRADLAAVCGADGVHVGQEDLHVAQARQVIGARGWVGVSTHSLDQANRAVLDGASYLGVGPVFASATKHFSELAGVKLVAEVAAHTQLPFFAIGGITIENLAQVLEAGATRVAVGRAIVEASSPSRAVEAFRKILCSRPPANCT